MSDEIKEAAQDFEGLVQAATDQFFDMMEERHSMGQEKYGPLKFMEVNTLEWAMEEVVDLANYALYTFVKLSILNQQIDKIGSSHEMLGPSTFIPAKGK